MKCEELKALGLNEMSEEQAATIHGGWAPLATWAAKKALGWVAKRGIFTQWGNSMCGAGNWRHSPVGPICKVS